MTAAFNAARLVSLDVAAARLDISPRTLRRRIADGTMPAYRVGRLIKINPDDLGQAVRTIPTAAA